MTSPTALEFAFATPADLGGPDRYRTWCAEAGLPPVDGGYGLLLAEDTSGQRVTRLTEDVQYLRALVTGSQTAGLLTGLEIPAEVFPRTRSGWPDEWTGGTR